MSSVMEGEGEGDSPDFNVDTLSEANMEVLLKAAGLEVRSLSQHHMNHMTSCSHHHMTPLLTILSH